MPQVPISRGNQVSLAPLPSQNIRPTDVSAVGRAVGQGMQQLGQAGDEHAAVQEQLGGVHDQAVVKEATSGISRRYAEAGFTGPNAYYSTQGKAALSARPTVEQDIDGLIDLTKKSLKTDRQRRMFDEAMIPQRTSWGVQIAQHADKETLNYEADESSSRLAVSGELARMTYIRDPEDGERQIGTGLLEIDSLGRAQGWGPDKLTAEKLKFTSGVYRDIGARLAFEDDTNGPALAQAFVEKHGGSMLGDDREAVLTRSRVAQNEIESEQRRREAEAARLAREQAQDAKDRANSVLRNIADGVPVDAPTLAGAIADAGKADDPALAEGLRQGGFKNSLTREYAGASPVEIQGRVNALSAQIAREGEKVKPDTLVERDHLQTLLGKANTAIGSDSISWGAAALRLDPGALKLGDPRTIEQRADFVRQVSRRTGIAPAQVFTNEEAATLSPVVVNGTVDQKTKMAVRLAQFGPLASVAARQIAPNNAGFQNLVGLAGLNNRGVAMSRVNQVVAGQEILKTNSKLIDKPAAQREFLTMTGGALQFLPSVKVGVFDNAQAILANDANEKGATEWGQARPRWFAAVNSALGAYSRGGKQIGGLAQFNGATTIVPEDMPVEDFERRVSRAHGPQMRAAANGVPVFANGRSPTATDVRKMQWVPVRDGVYRIGTGSEFLRLKGGGFYEINARKLP